MDNSECILMVRGQKPLKAKKIRPDEIEDYSKLQRMKVTDYVPEWRKAEERKTAGHHNKTGKPDVFDYDEAAGRAEREKPRQYAQPKLKIDDNTYDAEDYTPLEISTDNVLERLKKGDSI